MSGTFKNKFFALGLGLSTLFTASSLAQAAAAPAAAPSGSSAASPTTPAPSKIGIVNIQEAIISTNEGKKELEALQQKFSPKQAELKNMNDEVENLKKTFQAQSDKLNDEERNTRAKEIEAKQKSLQRSYEDAQNDFQQAEQEMINRIGGKMLATLEKYAKANGYAVVLDVSNPQTPVLWANQGTVITKELVDAYNTSNPSAAPAAKPATGAAAHPVAPRPHTTATPKKP
ncbi:MAG TPA: OmpH family outer membrane protein [Terriglobales bacterium]|nr:OmpH family outer membrane protein [Terriglobales bacterium]